MKREQHNKNVQPQQLNTLPLIPFHYGIPEGFYPCSPYLYRTAYGIPTVPLPIQIPYMSAHSLHNRQTNYDSFIPDWLYQSIRAKFNKPDLVLKRHIDIMTVHMKPAPETQIAAFARISSNDGVFVLFEEINGRYQEVFVMKVLVDGVQPEALSIVLKVLTMSGAGIWESRYYVIRHTIKGYKVVWSDLAQSVQSIELPYVQFNGGISFVDPESFIYFYWKITTHAPEEAPSIEKVSQLYQYNEQNMRFELVPG